MEKIYIWFAVKVNLFLLIITMIVGMLSGIFLWPLNLIFALTDSEFLKLTIATIWMSIMVIIPNYFVFKYMYRGNANVQNLHLIEAIIYVIALKIIIDLIYINFSEEYIEIFPTILTLLINSIVIFIAFYFAGVKYQPTSTKIGGIAGNDKLPPSNQN